ncbi:hypothetical protein [uncultured Aquimarina sp.]|uniref:hypothetical protein n=1 Tax=uncultured Aquimarina sp. TaxID=575652 RepID=UPI002638D228|nr:hypothetical protein [uncultured Aquimarina sp.]
MNKITYLLLLITFIFNSCFDSSNSKSNTTILDSDDYESKIERVEILKNEIKYFSDFEDAEFELFNVNGFSDSRIALPGASSWDYKFVIKINPSDVNKWTDGMEKILSNKDDKVWMNDIIEKRKIEWKTTSSPELYNRQGTNVLMTVYRSEGIIYKRVVNL